MSTDPNSKDKLKFREPGFRDTVVRVNNQKTALEEKKPANPLFVKIRETLTHSDPAKWEKYGDELNSEIKYPKSYERWEIAYCIDLPNGLLTFRSTQNVLSEYFGGGYTLKADGKKTFRIELRPRSWDPRTLIDPFFRSTLEKDKQFKSLADGDVAKELFELIEKTFVNFSSQKQRSIAESIQDLANTMLETAGDTKIEEWTKNEAIEGKLIYTAVLKDVNVEVTRHKRLDLFYYDLVLSRDSIKSQIKDPTLAKDLFIMLDEKSKNSALEALQNVLDEAGF